MAVNALSSSSPLIPAMPDPVGPGGVPGGAGPSAPDVGAGSSAGVGAVPDAQGSSRVLAGDAVGNGGVNGASRFTSAKFTDPSRGQGSGIDEARLQKALAEIRDVSSSGIDLLARVMLEQQGMQRHEAVQDRVQMRTLARESLLQAAGELNKQADAMQTAAIVQLVVACVTAAITIVGAVGGGLLKAAGGASERAEFADNFAIWGKEVATGLKTASKLSTAGEALGGAAQGAGKLGEAMGSFAGTEGQIAVKQSEANQKIDEANAQQYEAQADLKKGMQDAFDDNMKQIIAFVKELKDAVADLQSAITRHA